MEVRLVYGHSMEKESGQSGQCESTAALGRPAHSVPFSRASTPLRKTKTGKNTAASGFQVILNPVLISSRLSSQFT
jgi:hypothetical protein